MQQNEPIQCKQCNAYNDDHVYRTTCVMCGADLNTPYGKLNKMTDREELYKTIFARERIVAAALTPAQRIEWIERLSQVAFEAKVAINAFNDADREERAKVQGESRNWLTSNDYSEEVEASIQSVKTRKDRMSKADKLLSQLKSLGIADAESMMTTIEKSASANGIASIKTSEPSNKPRTKLITSELCRLTRHNECVGRFKDDSGSQECQCDCHRRKAEINAVPFDITDPFGLNK